ncbi:Sugar transport system, permease protein [Candidatus Phytoplasma australiense]|uniref:Sugar transport system, permease protein n=2 Tax=Phytoplasma australiense TaxID=59748 RepID=B1V8X2_PHYAS|nr:sugar ABC transporter permease [Candidatus Phytoplasma australiense]AGL89955.1 putative ABC transporter permease protein [Strawberry lethal yellows phytoplasma (CPA) str. NZSb11]CAM11359.1 Sugar transport system, permease protein [Candidatus Phytoplasma australiense]
MSALKKFFKNKNKHKHWYYLAPALLLVTVFNFYPLTKTFFISLNHGYDKFTDVFSSSFNFNNYVTIFKDPDFRTALLNTFVLVFIAVPISIFISLMISLALNYVYNHFLKKLFQTVFFLPYLTNSVVMGMVFAVLFYHNIWDFKNSTEGLLSFSHNWISHSASYFNKMFILIFYVVWRSLPFHILIFSVALKNISKNYFDAARIDGATNLTIFKKITFPLILPSVFYQVIITMIQVFKEYESVVGIFGANETKVNTIVGYIYHQASNPVLDSYSKGAAATIILLLISIFFTLLNFHFMKKFNRE